MADPESVLEVCYLVNQIIRRCANYFRVIEDFALMEASCAIVRVLQTFPNIRLPPDIIKDETGQERQNLTIVVSSAEGCKVLLD